LTDKFLLSIMTHSTKHQSKFLLFFKTREKFFKGAAGACFNFTSRVTAGVLAGYITTQVVQPPITAENLTEEQIQGIAAAAAAAAAAIN
jgi:hypothetical protein